MPDVPNIKITCCMVTFNRFEETQKAIRHHAPFADRFIVIDGGSRDGTVEWLNSEECKKMNVECYVQPWVDDPPGQRTRYLNFVDSGWILVVDCDEYLEIPALYKLRQLAGDAESKGCDGVAFVAHDIQFLPNGWVHDSLSNYYNRIFFKACPNMRYIGHTHVSLVRPGMRDACMKTEYKYYHIKAWADMFIRGCRNYWTTSECAQNSTNAPEWKEFKSLVGQLEVKYFHEFFEYMKQGGIWPDLKKWFIAHKEDANPEARSWFVSYFMFLHPEENVDKLGNRDLPFEEGRKPTRLMA